MKNKAFLRIEVCGHHHTIESNEVELHLLEIEFEKFGPECNHVVIGERVEFRIKLKNKSDKDLHDVLFTDPLQRGLEFVMNSFRVNGEHVHPEIRRGNIEYCIREFKAHAEIEIHFEVVVRDHHHDHDHDHRPCRPGRPCRPERH